MARATCSRCMHWRPHVHYPYIGYCTLHGGMTFDDYSCPGYKPLRINGSPRLYWCQTCKTRLTPEEAREHAARGDRVYLGAYIDPDVREEIYDSF